MLFKYNERKYFFLIIIFYIYTLQRVKSLYLELNPYIRVKSLYFIDTFSIVFDCNCDHPNDDKRRQCQSSGRGVQTRHTLSLFSPREGLR